MQRWISSRPSWMPKPNHAFRPTAMRRSARGHRRRRLGAKKQPQGLVATPLRTRTSFLLGTGVTTTVTTTMPRAPPLLLRGRQQQQKLGFRCGVVPETTMVIPLSIRTARVVEPRVENTCKHIDRNTRKAFFAMAKTTTTTTTIAETWQRKHRRRRSHRRRAIFGSRRCSSCTDAKKTHRNNKNNNTTDASNGTEDSNSKSRRNWQASSDRGCDQQREEKTGTGRSGVRLSWGWGEGRFFICVLGGRTTRNSKSVHDGVRAGVQAQQTSTVATPKILFTIVLFCLCG
mmetsp:Transcript_1979/g.4200  ORF Transcript_1979/g.4200 Transcript_1979/m.4200 type:complete len:287 (+) Transcript_1979:779-1639(+)